MNYTTILSNKPLSLLNQRVSIKSGILANLVLKHFNLKLKNNVIYNIMKTYKPKNLQELLDIKSSIRIDGYSPYLSNFRGQIYDWNIKPNITRNKLSNEKILNSEKKFLNDFKNKLIPEIPILKHFQNENYKYAQDWHNLFQAQHLGFYTRLTDWTQDFDTGLFFATLDNKKEYKDKSGVLWIFKCPYYEGDYLINFNQQENFKYFDIHPLELDKTYLIKHYSQFSSDFMDYVGEIRSFRQNGNFIIPNSKYIQTPIEEDSTINKFLEKIIITPTLKREISENHLSKSLEEYLLFNSKNNNKQLKMKEILNIRN